MKTENMDQLKSTQIKCKVCQVQTSRKIRCGAFVCEACKRFYLRNRTIQNTLECKYGSNRCLKHNRVELTSKGVIWRHMCTSCRFQKCLDVGMGQFGSRNSLEQGTNDRNEETIRSVESSNGASSSQISVEEEQQQQQQQQEMIERLASYFLFVNSVRK